MNTITEQRSKKIQVLRGLAIIAVVFIHTTPVGMAQVFCRPFLNFAVGLFLFLSGMLSDAKKWKPAKRLLKVLIPYFIWTFIYTLMISFRYPEWILKNYIHYLVFGNAAAIMYYIFVYCEFTLLIPLIDKLANSRYKYFGFVISPLEIICMRLIPMIIGSQLPKLIAAVMNVSCLGWFTLFYLGYLIGNGHIKVRQKTSSILLIWAVSIFVQMLEGYWYYSMGITNCGTQMKLSAIFSSSLFCLMAYKYIESDSTQINKPLVILGDYSFGIYFSHLAIKKVLSLIPGYDTYVIYPFSALILLVISFMIVITGHKVLGRYSKYIAF